MSKSQRFVLKGGDHLALRNGSLHNLQEVGFVGQQRFQRRVGLKVSLQRGFGLGRHQDDGVDTTRYRLVNNEFQPGSVQDGEQFFGNGFCER